MTAPALPLAATSAPRILRLVKIVDTREREERDGMYSSYSVPMPGTGIENTCTRCGAGHEVHAYVEVEGGFEVIVGTGCARRAAMDAGDAALARAISTAERRAKVRAAVVAEIARLRRLVRERAASEAIVAAMPVPAAVWAADNWGDGRPRWSITCGDAVVWSHAPREPVGDERAWYARERVEERDNCARRSWAEKRHAELGTAGYEHTTAPQHLRDAEERLAKIDRKAAA